ncbi:pitrilysin family protein [Clostridium sp. KNHs214]|uniref:M16 family metallopeptidase n=1 Tax=Clostridium sp. KNHs214 TaxID=1540257 RepID=UPI00054DB1D5|nr:pitrilysin family protein [Clostridium sp. KNHs214]
MYEVLSFYLSNGLKVIVHKISKIKTMSCGIWVKQGSKHEDNDINGFSHLIEHLLVSSVNTENKAYKDIIDKLSLYGVQYNATTTKEYTNYTFTGLNNMLDLSLDALANIVMLNKNITKEKLKIEKNIVRQELISFYSSFNQIVERTSQALWGNLDIGRIIVGNMKNIEKCNMENIREIIDFSYTPENSVLVIIGDIEYEDVLNMVNEKFSMWQDIKTREYKEIVSSLPGIYINNENKGNTSVLSIGFRLNSEFIEKNIPVEIISTILGHPSLDSRIMKKIRVECGLAYELSSFISKYSTKGSLAFTAITSNENVEKTIKLLIEEIKKAKNNFFTENEIKKAKNILETEAVLKMNDLTKHLKFLGNSAINNEIFSLENEVRKIQNCTNEMIMSALNDIFINENMGLAAIGSFDADKIIGLINI